MMTFPPQNLPFVQEQTMIFSKTPGAQGPFPWNVGKLPKTYQSHTSTLPDPIHSPPILNHQSSLPEHPFKGLNDPLKRRLGAFFLREACKCHIGATSTVEYRMKLGREGKRRDVEGLNFNGG